MGDQSHRTIPDEGLDSLNWEEEGAAQDHDDDEDGQHFILIHEPEEPGEELKEDKRIHDLIPEDVPEGSDGYLQDVILVELFLFFLSERGTYDASDHLILDLGLEAGESFIPFIVVELSLLEMKNVEVFTTLELLLVEVDYPERSWLALSALCYENVGGVV